MGFDSDLFMMSVVVEVFEFFGIGCEVIVILVYRMFECMNEYARSAYTRGLRVIIVGVGGVVYLFGMVVVMIFFFVIGVLVLFKYFDGMDFLFFIV